MQRARRAFWVAWGALVLLRALLGSQLPLLGDEAFYAWEARHLAWAYSDVPPMTAWLIAAGTALAGAGESGVRLGFLALGALIIPAPGVGLGFEQPMGHPMTFFHSRMSTLAKRPAFA